jgi:Predicted pyridoxal phosphate-dependent enzyme apparently involved in regulation of cell wall biogenesis
MNEELAVLGGKKAIEEEHEEIFAWPIITREDEEAVLEVLRRGGMSGTKVTKEFEKEFAAWNGTRYALGFNNGTASLHAAMYGCKVGIGDEIICPSLTYWASATQAFSLGATMVFADIEPDTLCIDPKDIEKRITGRTKAILVVHYCGHPADMDAIMEIARRHNIKVIEDVSHAQGGLYKGRKLGTIGDVAAMSLMSGKSLVAGEAGMLVTDDTEIYERAIALGHYERFDAGIRTEYLKPYIGLPLGGYKYRMNQLSSALGRVQLKYYDKRCEEIRKSVNLFWDILEGAPGIRAHRVKKDSDSNMAGWYIPMGFYISEELEGLSITRFTEAVRAEGFDNCWPGCNVPMHLHPLFTTCDVYGHGKPTRIANSDYDVRRYDNSLPVSEKTNARVFKAPWFKTFNEEVIMTYASAFIKVVRNYKQLLEGDKGDPATIGKWNLSGGH